MVKFYTLAFFIAAIGIFGMLDYAQQADKNGYPPLEYGASRYYHDRFDGIGTKWAEIRAAEALKDRQSVSASTHLPEAPEGWTRRDWAEFDKHLFFYAENKPLPIVAVQNKVFQKHGAFTDYAALFQAEQQRIEQEAKLNFMDKAMLPAQDKMLNRDVKIYYTANELIALRATYDRRFDKKKTHSELSMIVMANKMQMQSSLAPRHHGFAVYNNVAFALSDRLESGPIGDISPKLRVYKATMTPKIKIEAWAYASEASVHKLLAQIDFVALNDMLENQVPGVTPDPQPVPLAAQAALADQLIAEAKQRELEHAKEVMKSLRPGLMGKALASAEAGGSKAGQNAEVPEMPPIFNGAAKQAGAEGGLMAPAGGVSGGYMKMSGDVAKNAEAQTSRLSAVMRAISKGSLEELNKEKGQERPQGAAAPARDVPVPQADRSGVPAPVSFTPPASMDKREGLALAFRLQTMINEPSDLQLRADGLQGDGVAEWAAMKAGTLPAEHPRYKVRQSEVAINAGPGSCLQLVNARVYCGEQAELLRTGLHMRSKKLARDAAVKRAVGGEEGVKVNRLGGGTSRSSAGTGLGKNCTMEGAMKRCTIE